MDRKRFLKWQKTKEPIYITKNGEGDLVVMNIDAFERTFKWNLFWGIVKVKLYLEICFMSNECC